MEKHKIEQAFKDYLTAKGYIRYEYFKSPTYCFATNYGVMCVIKGHHVILGDFTNAEKRGDNTWVRLSNIDYNNKTITNGLFNIGL